MTEGNKYLHSEASVPGHQQRRGFSMQYPAQGPEAFPKDDTSRILHSPLLHCNANEDLLYHFQRHGPVILAVKQSK